MNTKTMRLPPRRVLTPGKRNVGLAAVKPATAAVKPAETTVTKRPVSLGQPQTRPGKSCAAEPAAPNRLLAGYLAHEFLTNGTLFGEPLEPARAQASPVWSAKPSHMSEPEEPEPKRRRYVELAHLLRSDGTHLPEIVNPAQLARFLNL